MKDLDKSLKALQEAINEEGSISTPHIMYVGTPYGIVKLVSRGEHEGDERGIKWALNAYNKLTQLNKYMKRTRKKSKERKQFCIYIWQEEIEGATHTYIDHIGDEELYEELKKDMAKELLLKLTQPNN